MFNYDWKCLNPVFNYHLSFNFQVRGHLIYHDSPGQYVTILQFTCVSLKDEIKVQT